MGEDMLRAYRLQFLALCQQLLPAVHAQRGCTPTLPLQLGCALLQKGSLSAGWLLTYVKGASGKSGPGSETKVDIGGNHYTSRVNRFEYSHAAISTSTTASAPNSSSMPSSSSSAADGCTSHTSASRVTGL